MEAGVVCNVPGHAHGDQSIFPGFSTQHTSTSALDGNFDNSFDDNSIILETLDADLFWLGSYC